MPFSVDADFAGGNIHIDSIKDGVVSLGPDLRDTTTPWFYWYFRVSGAAGRTLKFVFDPLNVGVRGPAVSGDAGRSWRWLGAHSVKDGAFSYSFPVNSSEVRFSVGMPYVRSDWNRFLKAQAPSLFLTESELTKTSAGHEVPLLTVSEPGQRAPLAVALTARHHACEMMPAYVLEGLIEEIVGDDETGRWLRRQAEFFIVPFVDAAGVERGDQGKNRAPHDHNRDYRGEALYPEVRALKERLPAWADGRPLVTIDLHDPALSGPVHESIFFVEPENRTHAAELDRLIGALLQVQRGPIKVQPPAKLAFGSGFNSTSHLGKSTYSAWSGSLPNCLLAVSLEVAYAEALGCEVNAHTARDLGRDLAAALRVWLAPFLPHSSRLTNLATATP